jgi:hypothetical protein
LAIAEALAGRDAANTQWERDLSVSHNRIGDVLVAQGDLVAALTAFRKSLAIAEALAGRDAANTQWQRDLSISHNRIGDVRVAQGDLGAAWRRFARVWRSPRRWPGAMPPTPNGNATCRSATTRSATCALPKATWAPR